MSYESYQDDRDPPFCQDVKRLFHDLASESEGEVDFGVGLLRGKKKVNRIDGSKRCGS